MPANLPRLSELPPSVWAVAAALLLLALMLLLRRLWTWLLGPVFAWETERLARRGSTFWMRVIFIAAVLAALYSAWPTLTEISPDAKGGQFILLGKQVVQLTVMQSFSINFSHAFVFTHAFFVLIFTPLYFGGAITDEKAKRTLDFLLVTKLRDRDIILGKFGSRVLSLFAVEVAAIPVLAVTLLFGGVDLPHLLAGFAATALTILSLGSFAMLCSVLSRRTWTAIAVCFVLAGIAEGTCWLMGVDRFSSPIAFYIRLRGLLLKASTEIDTINIIAEQLALYAAVHLFLTCLCLLTATLTLRLFARGLTGSLERWGRLRSPLKEAEIPKPRRVYRTRARIPPVDDRSLIWKERYLGRTIAGTIIHNVATAYFVALATLLTGLAIYYDRSGVFELIRDYLRGFAVLAGILLMFGLGLRLAGSVTRERERQTLEALLTIPEFRRDVLQAKWVGAWLRTRVYGAGLVLALLLCALTGTSGVSPCFFALMVVLVHATFAANLGLYLSLVCRTTARASISFALIFLFLIAGSWAALELLPGDDKVEMVVLNDTLGPMQATFDDDSQLRAGVRALNPLLTWWHLLDRDPSNQIQSESEFEQRRESRAGHRHSADYYRRQFQEGMALLWGTMIYLAAAGILWLLADRRFRRQAEHGL